MNDPGNDLELTPVCDPPLRATSETPIGSCWWIEPSHPEIDPATGLRPPFTLSERSESKGPPGNPADES